MRPSIGAKSDVGRVRDGNEDSYLVQDPFFVVADGMGGHLAGDVASRIAVQTISERADDGATASPEGLEKAVKEANDAIYQKASSDPSLHGMGTTCTLVLVAGSEIHIAHVGDSRAYLLRSDELTQLTEDHTLVGRMVKEGRLQPEEAEHHPQRSIITRALGVDDQVEVDVLTIPIQEDDKILMCSDGLSSMLDGPSIHRILADNDDPQAAVEGLIDAANEAGGEDNITAVVLSFDGRETTLSAPAEDARLTQEVAAADVARRQETVQPGAGRSEATGAFRPTQPRPKPEPARGGGRKSHPILVTLVLILLAVGAAAAAFKYLIVENSYYVASNGDGNLAIYRGLPDDVLGITFQEEVEASDVATDALPAFLQEDVKAAIEAESLEDARTTLANLEERAQDEEFQRPRNGQGGGNG